jgi:hypothetical protein
MVHAIANPVSSHLVDTAHHWIHRFAGVKRARPEAPAGLSLKTHQTAPSPAGNLAARPHPAPLAGFRCPANLASDGSTSRRAFGAESSAHDW